MIQEEVVITHQVCFIGRTQRFSYFNFCIIIQTLLLLCIILIFFFGKIKSAMARMMVLVVLCGGLTVGAQVGATNSQTLLSRAHAALAETQQSSSNPLPVLTDNKLDRFIVVPEYNLLFCYVEKVGCTAFNRLFLKLRQALGAQKPGAGLWFSNTPDKHYLTKEDLEKMLVNKTW